MARDWEQLADWYDKKQGDSGDLWHRALIDPVLVRLVGDVKGLTVLDVGCGNGYLARRFAKAGAKVTAVDSSARMIKNGRAHDRENVLKIRYVRSDASSLEKLRDESFDLAYANMSLMDVDDAEGMISEVSRVLRERGRFVASISHPCFDIMSNSGWVREKVISEPPKVYRKVRGYREPFGQVVPWTLSKDKVMWTTGFHRPLNWYARAFKSSGMAITALEEPEPTKEFMELESDAPGFLEVPLHLVIEAMKL